MLSNTLTSSEEISIPSLVDWFPMVFPDASILISPLVFSSSLPDIYIHVSTKIYPRLLNRKLTQSFTLSDDYVLFCPCSSSFSSNLSLSASSRSFPLSPLHTFALPSANPFVPVLSCMNYLNQILSHLEII